MQCTQCRNENPAEAVFCNSCGIRIEATCPGCGQANPPGANFCNKCGQNFTGANGGDSATSEPKFASPDTYTPKYLAERILTSKGRYRRPPFESGYRLS